MRRCTREQEFMSHQLLEVWTELASAIHGQHLGGAVAFSTPQMTIRTSTMFT